MQVFKDTETGLFYQFDDDVLLDGSSGQFKFTSSAGQTLDVPTTLAPASLDEMIAPPVAKAPSVTRYQFREAMRLTRHYKDGAPGWTLFDAFEELLNDSVTPVYYRRAWDELQAFDVDGAVFSAAADVLGLSTNRRIDLFLLAASLKA